MPHPKTHQPRIVLIAGIILVIVTLLAGVTVFMVMQRNAEALLRKSLQSALQNRVQLTETEIRARFDSTVLISTRPLLIDQLQLVDARADDTAARNKLDMAARAFLQGGLTALALYGEDGQELTRAGIFAQQPELVVPLNLPGHVQLLWDGQLLLRSVVEIKKEGRVIGNVMTESSLPVTMGALKHANRLGETGEQALCASFGLKMQCFPTVLNPKIFTPSKMSPKGVPLPMTHALEGKTGFITTRDYRDQEVVAAYAPVGDLGLGMVRKMDRAELFAPVWTQLRFLIPLLLGVLVIALLLLRWLLTPLVVRLVRSEAQAVQRTTELAKEITERSQAETRSKALFDNSPDAFILLDSDGNIIEWNDNAVAIWGYGKSEVLGKSFSIVLPPQELGLNAGYRQCYQKSENSLGVIRELVGQRKDGCHFPLELRTAEMVIDKGSLFLVSARDITERTHVDKMKREFISTVSHELRTPLTSIRGALGLVAGGATGVIPDKARELVSIASNNCDRLVRLINDMLDMEKIESGKMSFDLQPVDLLTLVEEAVDANQAYAAQHQVKIAVEGEVLSTVVIGDRDRLIQVLTNLLSNAAKFTAPGGTVHLSLAHKPGKVVLRVRDEGPGIPEDFKSRIFQKFSQADASDTRSKGGTGLGLSITKAIVEHHGGQIGFESVAGQGTTFWVNLPARPAVEIDKHQPGQARVLVVEDDQDVAKLLRLILEHEGYTVDVAYSIAQARERLASGHYAALTLDLLLPGESGVAFVRELHERPESLALPIVVVSAVVERGRKELNDAAVSVLDWLEKPIDEARLLQAVAEAVKLSKGKLKVLHVEDDADIASIVSTLLEGVVEVDVAATLKQAHVCLDQNEYALVILDIGLPDGSGLDLLPRLGQLKPPIPILVFSAQEVNVQDYRQVSAVFVKSRVDIDSLACAIRAHIAARDRDL